MANGSSISRSAGTVLTVPTFAGLVNLIYTGSSAVTTARELPLSSSTLNNLTANAGGVIQNQFTETASILYSQGFNGAPADWTTEIIIDPYSPPAPSINYVTAGTHPSISPSEGTQFVLFNSYTCQSGDQIRLKKNATPVSTTGKTSITMVFDWYVDPGYATANDYVTVQWSTDGDTWNNSNSYYRYNASAAWTTINCVLPVGAENQATLYVAFLFTSVYGNDCSLDNLVINGSVAGVAPSAYTINGILDLTAGTYTIGADNSLTLNGGLTGSSAIIGSTTTNLSVVGSGATITLPAVTNGLNNFTLNRLNSVVMNGNVTVNGTLTLTDGILTNGSYLTMANASTISRSGGLFSESPTFAGTVNLLYTGSSPITTGFETPVSAGVLNNLTVNAGGVTQGVIQTAPVNILTDAFSNITGWTGDKGTSYNQFAAVASSNAGGTANECRYAYGSDPGTVYTASIYRSVNTVGYTSLNISWKQFIDNYDAVTYPYTLKVQCASSSGGPWTDIYSYSPSDNNNTGPETKNYNHWTTNVGGTFFIRYYITGKTYGIDFWYIDDLVIDGLSTLEPSTVTVNGTLDVSAGTYSIASNTLALNSGISGSNAIVGGATSNLSVGGSSSNLTLSGITGGLKDFTISRPNGVTLSGNLTVEGVLNLQSANASATQGTLHMGTNTLTMGASATTIGTGDVTGIVKRNSFVAGIPYSFGNQYSTFTFENVGTLPTDMSMKISIGTAPAWKTDGIKRITSIIRTGGSGSFMTLNVHYLDAELNGNAEDNLVGWVCITPFTPGSAFEMGRSNYDLTNNWNGTTGFDVSYLPTSFDIQNSTLAVSQISHSTWNGSVSTVWTIPENWTPTGVPSNNTDVVIPDAGTTPNDPTTIPTLLIGRLTLLSGAILNATTSSTITISGSGGAWSNIGGTFNAGSSTVIFTNAAATISGETNFYHVTVNSGATLTMGSNDIMRIGGTMTNSGTWNVGLLDNVVEYNGASQTVLNPNGPTSGYHGLILSGSGVKTMPGTTLTIHDDFILSGAVSATAAAALLVNGTISIGSGTSLNLASYSHTIAKDLINNGGTFTASTGSVAFNGDVLQTITSSAGISLNNLIVSNTNAAVTLGSSTNCSIAGDLTIDADAVLDLAANSLTAITGTLSNSGTIRTQSVSATPVPAGKSWGGSFEFTGTAAQTIVSGTYTNLIMSGSGGVTAGVNITVDGILNLASSNPSSTKGILDMGSYTLLMGSSATTTGPGDVTGIIRRTTIAADVTYSFGNQYTTINFPDVGTLPTELSMKVSLGTAPAWKPEAINRIYDFIQTGSSGTEAILYAHYLDSELNGNNENLLVDWVWISTPDTIEYGRSANNAVENWVQITNVNVGFFSSAFDAKELTLSESVLLALTWNGSVSTSWVTAGNWTPTGAPSDNTAVTIPDAGTTSYDATLPEVATCGLMILESGAILNASDSAVLTITGAEGAWNNLGATFNAGNSYIVFENANATMSGSTDFCNLTLDTGSDLTLDVDTYLGITGVLTNNGNFGRVDKGTTTVDYKGGDQTVVVPNLTTNRYHMLVLSGTGTKTFPATALEIVGDLTLAGTVTAVGAAVLTMSGNLSIGEGSVFNSGNFNDTIAGNFYNNGTYTHASGYGLTMNGDLTQTIEGTGTTNFNNLTISNTSAEGVMLNNDVTTNNVLTINSGSKLTINPAANMNVVDTITNSEGASGLVIKANPSIANGTLIFHNEVGSPVQATVEMYSIAYKDDNATVKYKWQYFGVPLRTITASPTFDGGFVRRWNEPTSAWIQLSNASTLSSFVGHEITQLTAKTYVFEGQLENGDFNSGTLSYTTGALFKGQHIFGNPYTAAIDITQLTFGTQTEASVYLYNTGSSADWSANNGGGSLGTSPGQYTVAPKLTAGTGGIPGQIPSMQGFLVKAISASEDATFAIPYSSVITKNTDLQRAPAAGKTSSSLKVFTRIDVSGSRYSDRMWIFIDPTCTRGFDNGWDGYKFPGSALTPQLFAIEELGDFQIDAVNDIDDTYLGFKAGEDSKYTLSFTHENMENIYTSLYLQDLQDNTVIDITQSGTNYTFLAQDTAAPVKRFKIVSSPGSDTVEIESQLKIFASHQTIFIHNLSGTAGDIMLYDASGQFLRNVSFGADCVTAIPVSLPPGAYLVKATTETGKLNKKILIK